MAKSEEKTRGTLCDLIRDFAPEEILLTTYTLDLLAFEEFGFASIPAGAEVTILADWRGYQAAALSAPGVRGAGTRYRVLQVQESSFAFHPKVAIMRRGSRVVLAIGSGNLTVPGLHRNLEILDVLGGDAGDAWDSGGIESLLTIGSALRALLPQSVKLALFSNLASVPVSQTATAETATRIFHSIEKPLWQQIKPFLDGMKPGNLTVVTPFYDRNGEFLSLLRGALNPKKITLVCPNETWGLPASVNESLKDVELQYVFSDQEGKQRPLHAKVISYEDGEKGILITGSANCTRAAWLGSYLAGSGNAEVVALRLGASEICSKLLTPIVRKSASICLAEVDPEPEPLPSVRALYAEHDGTTLRIEVASAPSAECMIELWSSERLQIAGYVHHEGTRTFVENEQFEEPIEDKAVLARVRFHKLQPPVESSWVWVHSEELLSATEGEIECRRAIRQVLLGKSTIEELEAIVSYIAWDYSLHESSDKNPSTSESGTLGGRASSSAPHLIDLGEHSSLHGRRSHSGIAGSLIAALRTLAETTQRRNDKRLGFRDSDSIDEESPSETLSEEVANEAEMLHRVYELILGVLEKLTTQSDQLPSHQSAFLLECSLLVFLHLRAIGELESTYVFPTAKCIFTLVKQEERRARLTQHADLRQLCIFFLLLYCIDSTAAPTEEIKAALDHFGFKQDEFDSMYPRWSKVARCPEQSRLHEANSAIQKVVSRKELLTPLMTLYLIAAHGGKAHPTAPPPAASVEALIAKANADGLSLWVRKVQGRMARNGPALCLVDIKGNKGGTIICPACNTSLNSRTASNLRRITPTPEQCERCQTVLIGGMP